MKRTQKSKNDDLLAWFHSRCCPRLVDFFFPGSLSKSKLGFARNYLFSIPSFPAAHINNMSEPFRELTLVHRSRIAPEPSRSRTSLGPGFTFGGSKQSMSRYPSCERPSLWRVPNPRCADCVDVLSHSGYPGKIWVRLQTRRPPNDNLEEENLDHANNTKRDQKETITRKTRGLRTKGLRLKKTVLSEMSCLCFIITYTTHVTHVTTSFPSQIHLHSAFQGLGAFGSGHLEKHPYEGEVFGAPGDGGSSVLFPAFRENPWFCQLEMSKKRQLTCGFNPMKIRAWPQNMFRDVWCVSRMRSEGFLFNSGGLG